MDDTRVLMLNCCASVGPSFSLRAMLETAIAFKFRVLEETLPIPFGELTRRLSDAIQGFSPHLVLVDLQRNCLHHAETILGALQRHDAVVPWLVAVETVEPEMVCRMLEFGASDVVTLPCRAADILPRLWRLRQQAEVRDEQIEQLKETLGMAQFVGQSRVFLEAIKNIPAMAACDASVLITGETGTGKEICARAIHYLSRRSEKPFLPINCGAIPVELVENELFGHEAGAFTGATAPASGVIREANGGTLFLDEVDCLPPAAQVKLLRLLQEKEFRPLGSNRIWRADVRVVAASNADLEERLHAGRVRRDLYYRLNVLSLHLPPLRDRTEDIPPLARHFQTKYAAIFEKRAKAFSSAAMQKLVLYSWPGNVRELENVVERAVALSELATIHGADIHLPGSPSPQEAESFQAAKARVVADFEKDYIQQLLLANEGNITHAAKAANKNRRAFWQLMRKHRITVLGQIPALGRTKMSA